MKDQEYQQLGNLKSFHLTSKCLKNSPTMTL